MNRVAVMFSLPIEARKSRSSLGDAKVGVSGVGADQASAMAKELVADRPAALIAAGFAGALHPGLRTGDIIAAMLVTDSTDAWMCDARLVDVAVDGGAALCKLVSASELVATPEEKSRLYERIGCGAVDMESAAAASVAADAGVPFVAVRVILDARTDALSPVLMQILGADGELRPARLVASVLRRPRLIGEMLGLSRRSKIAEQSLAEFLGSYVQSVASNTGTSGQGPE